MFERWQNHIPHFRLLPGAYFGAEKKFPARQNIRRTGEPDMSGR